jgi:erythromycin esterase-like protein
MWRNTDVEAFVSFLREHNATKAPAGKVGFYGLDLYNMTASIAAVLVYLDRIDPQARWWRASIMPACPLGPASQRPTDGHRLLKAVRCAEFQ